MSMTPVMTRFLSTFHSSELLHKRSYSNPAVVGLEQLSEGYFATRLQTKGDENIKLWNKHGRHYATYNTSAVQLMTRLIDGSIVTFAHEELNEPPNLRIRKQLNSINLSPHISLLVYSSLYLPLTVLSIRLPFSSLVDRCCLAVVIHFRDSKVKTEDLKEAIRQCGLPVELRQLLVKFCSATFYGNVGPIRV